MKEGVDKDSGSGKEGERVRPADGPLSKKVPTRTIRNQSKNKAISTLLLSVNLLQSQRRHRIQLP